MSPPEMYATFSSRVLLAVIMAVVPLAPLHAAHYEVAQAHSKANDDGPGTPEQPWKTISRAAEKVGPGDLVVIRGGVYRERIVIKASGTTQAPIRFEAAPGERVVLTGADRLALWQRAESERPIYRVAWPHRFNTYSKTMTHPGDEYHRVIGRCEQVAVNGYLLRQVLSSEQLAPGAFFADTTNQTLYVWDSANRDLKKDLVEAAVRSEILRVEGEHVRVRGLRFRYAANAAQRGAVVLAGDFAVLEDCVVEEMNSSGATFSGKHLQVRRCAFRNNGQLGFSANRAHDLLFTDCWVENNNTKNFDRGWEAGGNKLVLCRKAVLEKSRFVRNRGHGIWFDIGNEQCAVRQCLIAENEDSGIFYEISFGLQAHDNVIVGNGFATTPGAWGAQAGISISSSPDCVIERNLMLGNREGFNFREQLRTTPTIEDRAERPVWNHDEWVHYNIIALNRDAQVWGWFDVKDNRHWPAAAQTQAAPLPKAGDLKAAEIPRSFASQNKNEQPQGLTLEKLRLQFQRNIFFAAPGQGWFRWGTTWGRHKTYASLPEFESDLGVDKGSQTLDLGFADFPRSDFRLDGEIMSRAKECYPQGSVPETILGVRP